MNMSNIEKLAEEIYTEVCRVFREQTGGNSETICPFAEQGEAVRQAYIRAAVVANTFLINHGGSQVRVG